MKLLLTSIPKIFLPPLIIFNGVINVFSFAPYAWWPLQLMTLGILVYLLINLRSIRCGALLGWCYGFGCISHGVYWIYISLHKYGGFSSWLAILMVVAIACSMGLYTGLCTATAVWLHQRWEISSLGFSIGLFPALWVLTEWLRGCLFTGFPWLISGYAHTTTSPLAGFAPIFGVYGVGGISALIAGCLAMIPERRPLIIVVSLILMIGISLRQIDWTKPCGKPISVRLLQSNIRQEEKFSNNQITDSLQLHMDMIRSAPADLIATPETAITIPQTQLPKTYMSALSKFSLKNNSHITLGIPYSYNANYSYNSVVGISPKTKNTYYRYNKKHLVPFGEFFPLGFGWFIKMLDISFNDFRPGMILQTPFAVKNQLILPSICYENLFGEEIVAQLAAAQAFSQSSVTLLLNMSNIAWFGNTIALSQQLQILQMRSIETGRPMLCATNTGPTVLINSHGKVEAQLGPYKRAILDTSVQGYEGTTPYILFGNRLVLLLALSTLIINYLRQCKTDR